MKSFEIYKVGNVVVISSLAASAGSGYDGLDEVDSNDADAPALDSPSGIALTGWNLQ